MSNSAPYLCFYGDDFTGSTDVLDALASVGIQTVLFLSPPDDLTLQRFYGADAIGIAGMSRTMAPESMETDLPAIFRWMAATGASILHYKVCSTFDSSPLIGSIGKAMDLAAAEFGTTLIPILAGVPRLGRYCIFGNLFARAGAGAEVFRLDRHPIMSRHPITPMSEADLRRHLGRQTLIPVHSVSALEIEAGHLPSLGITDRRGCEAVLFDTVSTEHLKTIGHWLHRCAARADRPLFCVGSSAVEYALAEAWSRKGGPRAAPSVSSRRDPDAPIVVVSGSCSAVTARQIDFAAAHGFESIHLPVTALSSTDGAQSARIASVRAALAALERGLSPMIFTARGEPDARFDTPSRLGDLLGEILSELIDASGVRRVAVAGGDTSGFVAKSLRIQALEVASSVSPGAPLCRAYRDNAETLEIALKGGQMGADDFFARVRAA